MWRKYIEFKSLGSCGGYKTGKLEERIVLPDKEPGCRHCPYIRVMENVGRIYCTKTGEPLFADRIFKEVGQDCPVEWEEN